MTIAPQNSQIVAYGDSLADGFASATGVRNLGIVGHGLYCNNLAPVSNIHPGDTVYMFNGWNDLEMVHNNPDGYYAKVKARLNEIKAQNGGAPVAVVGLQLLPGGKTFDGYGNDTVEATNKISEKAAKETGVTYVALSGCDKSKTDGVHLTPNGSKQAMAQIQNALNGAPQQQLPPTTLANNQTGTNGQQTPSTSANTANNTPSTQGGSGSSQSSGGGDSGQNSGGSSGGGSGGQQQDPITALLSALMEMMKQWGEHMQTMMASSSKSSGSHSISATSLPQQVAQHSSSHSHSSSAIDSKGRHA